MTSGRIIHPQLIMDYDYSVNAFTGPETLNEYIMKIFRSYHYLNFFDKIHIDKKVQKLFRDSVKLVNVIKLSEQAERECKNCNYLILLKFKDITYPYEIFITDNLLETFHNDGIEILQKDDLIFKFYNSVDKKGVYIVKNNANKKDKKLSLLLTSGNFEEFKTIMLQSIKNNTLSGIKK